MSLTKAALNNQSKTHSENSFRIDDLKVVVKNGSFVATNSSTQTHTASAITLISSALRRKQYVRERSSKAVSELEQLVDILKQTQIPPNNEKFCRATIKTNSDKSIDVVYYLRMLNNINMIAEFSYRG
jgi:hypothetical protein